MKTHFFLEVLLNGKIFIACGISLLLTLKQPLALICGISCNMSDIRYSIYQKLKVVKI
jgi:hypothetical protein